jgi:hypothetical protein
MLNFYYLLFYLAHILVFKNISTNGENFKSDNTLSELFLKMFIERDYSNSVRPTLNATSRLTRIETELKLLQIDLDEKYQELISTAWIEMTWFDNRLAWNPDEYNGITEITLDVNKIWVNINKYTDSVQ